MKNPVLMLRNIITQLYVRWIIQFNTRPREELKIFDFNPYKKKKANKWSIENSIFNNY